MIVGGAIVVVAVLVLCFVAVKTPVDDFDGDANPGGSSGWDDDDFQGSDDPVFAYAIVTAEGSILLKDGVLSGTVADMDVTVNPFISVSQGQVYESAPLLSLISIRAAAKINVVITGPSAFVADWESDAIPVIGFENLAGAEWEAMTGRCFFNVHGTYNAVLTVYGAYVVDGEMLPWALLTSTTKTFNV